MLPLFTALGLLIVGTVLLVVGANWFLDGAGDLARTLGVSALVFGVVLPTRCATCMTYCMDYAPHDMVLHATSSRSKQAASERWNVRDDRIGADTKSFYRRLKGGSSMLSEADLIAKRAALRWLAKPHPQWTHQDLADALSMSRSWVSKWFQRLHQADPDDIMALHSRTPARHTPPASIASQPAVVQCILEIRLAPPENLQRVPGPEAIL